MKVLALIFLGGLTFFMSCNPKRLIIKEKHYSTTLQAEIPYSDTTFHRIYVYDTIENVVSEIVLKVDTIHKTIYLLTNIRNKSVELPDNLVVSDVSSPKKVKIHQRVNYVKEVNKSGSMMEALKTMIVLLGFWVGLGLLVYLFKGKFPKLRKQK